MRVASWMAKFRLYARLIAHIIKSKRPVALVFEMLHRLLRSILNPPFLTSSHATSYNPHTPVRTLM
jgi:hypothetical protein